MMDRLRQDLRFALRRMRRAPAAAAIIILSVALGIGAFTAAFSLVWALVLRSLPYTDPERLLAITAVLPGQPETPTYLSFPDYLDLRAENRSFAGMEAYFENVGLTFTGGEPERAVGAQVSAGMFPLLGVKPLLGRVIRPEEDRWRAVKVVLLGFGLWQRRFGGDPAIVGKTIQANGFPFRVVGVMPPGFTFPNENAAWTALGQPISPDTPRSVRRTRVVARLRPGVNPETARREVAAFGRRLAALHPADAGWSLVAVPLRRGMLMEDDLPGRALAVLAAVVSVLLMACANIASLLLAQAVERRREITLRAALGAGPGRIVRQLLTESLVLALAGGVLGLALGAGALRSLRALLPQLPYGLAPTADPPALAAAFAVALLAGLLFAIVPALRVSRPDLGAAFRPAAVGDRKAGRLQAGLVIAEVTLAAVLLIAAALAVRTLLALEARDPGTATEHLYTAWISLSGGRYRDLEQRARLLHELVGRIAAAPGIEAAAAANFVFDVNNGIDGKIGRETAFCDTVTSGFFRAWGAPLLAGRDLTAEEGSTRSSAAVLNETLARRLWPDGRAVGRRFRLDGALVPGPLTVVGVAGDIRTVSLRAPVKPQVFVSAAYNPYPPSGLLVRTRLAPEATLAVVRRTLRAFDPDLPLYTTDTMAEVRTKTLRTERLSSQGLALFGGVALFLALIGVYGVLALHVSGRRREIAVRLALGAPRAHLFRRLVGRGLLLTAAGLALGLLLARLAAQAIAGQLYGVSAADALSYAGVAILFLDVAFVACYLPARRALEVDPAEALAGE